MRNKKLIAPIFIFLVVSLVTIFTSVGLKRESETMHKPNVKESIDETTFSGVTYFSIQNNVPQADFVARKLRIIEDQIEVNAPRGHVYEDVDNKIDFIADQALMLGTKELSLKGNVELYSIAAQHKSGEIYYNGNKKFLEAKGGVESMIRDEVTNDRITITSNYLSSWPGEKRYAYIGNVIGELERSRKYERGFSFESNKLEMFMNKSLVTLEKNVKIHRKNYRLSAQKADIFLQHFNKKLKYFTLYDDIKLVETLDLPNGKTQERRAYSEKLESILSEGKTILSGAPRVEQGEDVIKGYQITLRENVEIVEVDDAQSSFNVRKDE